MRAQALGKWFTKNQPDLKVSQMRDGCGSLDFQRRVTQFT